MLFNCNMSRNLLITVLGPTATGKTAFAARLAHEIDGEVISADSRQVYRKMDIGTGKDIEDYFIDGRQVPCHLTDIVDAGYKYSLYEYQRDFLRVWNDLSGRGKAAVFCGGSGLYIESVLNAYKLVNVPLDLNLREELGNKDDSELTGILASYRAMHNVSDTSSRKRLIRAIEIAKFTAETGGSEVSFPEFESIIFGISVDRDQRRERITQRLEARLKSGLVDEVRSLLDGGLTPDQLIFYGLEYKFVTLYLTGEMDYDEMKSRLNTAIHQFAKRQMTWFRKMERSGFDIHWLKAGLSMDEKLGRALAIIDQKLSG